MSIKGTACGLTDVSHVIMMTGALSALVRRLFRAPGTGQACRVGSSSEQWKPWKPSLSTCLSPGYACGQMSSLRPGTLADDFVLCACRARHLLERKPPRNRRTSSSWRGSRADSCQTHSLTLQLLTRASRGAKGGGSNITSALCASTGVEVSLWARRLTYALAVRLGIAVALS